ncbi:hypothetical protein HYPSUDRAFT_529672 [Hypholoma sublateritium FD-334 SS-4]|uniref:Uncharacterized protein n=1 Tax=Hypholoma sublateritium (strain FD-334 SS-4) TaxID=945553 RepID=A0A0D2P0K2_HYPSF|nr:hypothetical protein HYPSUDRAFT_529672 [Hypholoma sublateritium FD-334 SS-4]
MYSCVHEQLRIVPLVQFAHERCFLLDSYLGLVAVARMSLRSFIFEYSTIDTFAPSPHIHTRSPLYHIVHPQSALILVRPVVDGYLRVPASAAVARMLVYVWTHAPLQPITPLHVYHTIQLFLALSQKRANSAPSLRALTADADRALLGSHGVHSVFRLLPGSEIVRGALGLLCAARLRLFSPSFYLWGTDPTRERSRDSGSAPGRSADSLKKTLRMSPQASCIRTFRRTINRSNMR